MKKSLFLFILTAAFVLTGAEFKVSGKVSAPDFKGVAICDGEKFYPVNKDGSFNFSFNYEGTGFVYLDYPSSLQPQGKWSAALKPGENTLQFKLVKAAAVPETFTFVHGSDVQYNFKNKHAELVNDMAEIASIIKNSDARFITFPGDLTEYGEPEQLALLRTEIEKNKMNYFAFFGGHDRLRSKPSYKNFTECFGAPYFGWHFGGIYFFSPVSEYMSVKEGYARTRQVAWMKNALSRLAPGTPVLVVTHQPWYVFDLVNSYAQSGKIKLLGFLGAHTHYHNLYEFKGQPVLCVAPLRSHDTGSFTKRLRLVKISKNGIVSSETRILNQSNRAEATLCNGTQLLLRVANSTAKAKKVNITVNGKTVALKQLNELVWQGTLPAAVSKANAVVNVETESGKWQKKIKLANIDKLAWCAVLPHFQRSYPTAVVQNGKIIVGIETGEFPLHRGGVAAFDQKSGKLLWRYTGADVASGVAADEKYVRALDVNTNLLTLDINTGKLIRSTALPRRRSMYTRTHSAVKLFGDKLLLSYTADGRCHLYCLDKNSDKMLWPKPLNLGSAWNAINFTAHNGIVYFTGAYLNGAANLSDGKILWQRKDAQKTSMGEILISGNFVYFYLRATLVKLDAKTGKLVWKDSVPGSSATIGGVCVKDGRVLGVSTNALIVDDEATGKRIYRRNLQPLHPSRGIKYQFLANTAAPKLWKDKVLVAGDDGAVYDMAPHMKKCNNKREADINRPDMIFETGFAFKGTPVIDGDMAYVIGFDGVLYAIKY